MAELKRPTNEAEFEANFAQLKPLMNSTEAYYESSRCLFCYDAPCMNACPTGIDIPLPDSVATAGGAFSEPTGSVLFSNSATGEADLAASVPGGPYSISYTTAGDCPATFTQSISIFPRPTQTALTAHPGGTVCAGDFSRSPLMRSPKGK